MQSHFSHGTPTGASPHPAVPRTTGMLSMPRHGSRRRLGLVLDPLICDKSQALNLVHWNNPPQE
jgi:hypothetical protein